MKVTNPAQREKRDDKARKRLADGQAPAEVAAWAGVTVRQLYRRLGTLGEIRRKADASR